MKVVLISLWVIVFPVVGTLAIGWLLGWIDLDR